MSNNPKSSKTNITKISARSNRDVHAPDKIEDRAKTKDKTEDRKKTKTKTEKPLKSIFILFRPFVAFGRYLRDSWREIRQVRWPGRKLTWKMTFAVLIYCAIFILFIVLLDSFFTFIFNLLLNLK